MSYFRTNNNDIESEIVGLRTIVYSISISLHLLTHKSFDYSLNININYDWGNIVRNGINPKFLIQKALEMVNKEIDDVSYITLKRHHVDKRSDIMNLYPRNKIIYHSNQ